MQDPWQLLWKVQRLKMQLCCVWWWALWCIWTHWTAGCVMMMSQLSSRMLIFVPAHHGLIFCGMISGGHRWRIETATSRSVLCVWPHSGWTTCCMNYSPWATIWWMYSCMVQCATCMCSYVVLFSVEQCGQLWWQDSSLLCIPYTLKL